jgi:hypothetical protein
MKNRRIMAALSLLLFLGACSGFAKGVTEAVLERSEREDQRQCHIDGPASQGLDHVLAAQEVGGEGLVRRELKVMMVHGIGSQIPGYSGRLTEHLMAALGLTVRSSERKELELWDHMVSDEPLGKLSVDLYTNPEHNRRLVFYELTWAGIIQEEKERITFDNATEHSFRRTQLNALMKRFINDTIPDAFIYLGDSQLKILTSVSQGFCWMTSGDWEDLPLRASERCDPANEARAKFAREDDFAFISHSLGSRIAIDVLQQATDIADRPDDPTTRDLTAIFRDREIPLYMLSNQLPLLEMGRPPPVVHEQITEYCEPDGALTEGRQVGRLNIYAFSDPNDLLSYPIPRRFAAERIDSRICPSITNISINVAKPVNLFGVSEFANPLAAHVDYDHDERVIDLIAFGIGPGQASPLIEERCSWVENADPR